MGKTVRKEDIHFEEYRTYNRREARRQAVKLANVKRKARKVKAGVNWFEERV